MTSSETALAAGGDCGYSFTESVAGLRLLLLDSAVLRLSVVNPEALHEMTL